MASSARVLTHQNARLAE